MTTLAVGSPQAAETIGVAASSFLHERATSAASAQLKEMSLWGVERMRILTASTLVARQRTRGRPIPESREIKRFAGVTRNTRIDASDPRGKVE